MGTFRAATILTGFFGLTVPLMPLQALFVRVSPKAARRFPHWYHRQVCKLMGVRLSIEGQVMSDRPVLLVSNHTSWLDIPVLDRKGMIRHDGGVVVDSPGMYLMGMPFLRRRKSTLIDGAGADANDLSTHLNLYIDGHVDSFA